MRVLMLGWEFPPYIAGGLGTACHGLAHALTKQGVQVDFMLPHASAKRSNKSFRIISASEVPIIKSKVSKAMTGLDRLESEYLQKTSFISRSLYPFSGGYGKKLYEEVYWYTRAIETIAKSGKFDVIHAHDWLTYPAGIAARAISGKPLVVHVHATEYDRSPKINPTIFYLEKLGMRSAQAVLAVSDFTRRKIVSRYGIPTGKVVVSYNGAGNKRSKDRAPRYLKEKVVTFLGRITWQKGPEYFIEAARKVLDVNDNVRFVMAGNGDLLSNMILKVARLKMSSKFHFTGFLKGAQVDRILGMSDVFVMPSVSEPFGIAPLEAMKSGVPVIVSRQSGVSEVLSSAIKVDFWDTDALSNAINGLLLYPSLVREIRKEGESNLRDLTWSRAAAVVNSTYRAAV